jgi:hypothetical protein
MAKQQSNYTERARETYRQGEMLAPITTRHHSWQRWWRLEVGGEVVVARQTRQQNGCSLTHECHRCRWKVELSSLAEDAATMAIITTVKATADAVADNWKEANIGGGNANNQSYYLLILITTTTTVKQKNFNIINNYI